MPDGEELRLVIGNEPRDLAQVRMPGLDKPFEELTVSELVQLRPGEAVADSYGVNAVTDNISVSTSSMLEELGQIQKVRAMSKVRDLARLNSIRAELSPVLGAEVGGVRALSAEPGRDEVRLPEPGEDVFQLDKDPFEP